MEHTKVAYIEADLNELKRPELNRLAKKLGLRDLRGKNTDIIERMVAKSGELTCEYDDMGEIIAIEAVKSNVRTHPVMGEYVKVTVTARDPDVNVEFFANNHYQARIRMGDEVMIPRKFVDFINKSCYQTEHFYDETKFNPETGKYGVHTKRRVQDFFASIV